MGHQERKIRDRENLRKSMLAAAVEIAEKEGWQALTIRKIADAIEYTAPIVYEHFTNKEELIREIIRKGHQSMIASHHGIFDGNLTPKEILLEVSLNHWDFAFENKVLYQLMFSLERCAPGDDIIEVMNMIKETFFKLTGKENIELKSIIFNWVCLMSGTISTVMMMDGQKFHHEKEMDVDPRSLYQSFIERFLNSID
jgi:AcrR family transcriptional regulator